MKSTFSSIALVSIACLQYLAGTSTAQVTSATASGAPVSPTSTTPAVVPTPTVPMWVNTPGLVVSSVFDGLTVVQNSFVSISATLTDGQPMSSIVITSAMKDGSGNTTIADIKQSNLVTPRQLWNVSADNYPVGSYVLSMIVIPGTPNTTATTGTSAVPQPSTGVTPPATGAASVYYWKANINVRAPPASTPVGGAASGLSIGSTIGYVAAAGVALLGSLLIL
ncbi:hypothetical protein EC957_010691 [Mortierella hygrophila]|uniref:Uncharacterized protein n=1 Tax=Mortierella hygrophila TaxID=979708 RepID=A0A9P6K4C2_9FUNG|nr:hypothetical protein EC957_010691 [Mortierella hygrophila]